MDKQNVQFDTFRIQIHQKLNDIDTTLNKMQSTSKQQLPPGIVIQRSQENTPMASRRASVQTSVEQLAVPQQGLMLPPPINSQTLLFEELARLRELIETRVSEQPDRMTTTAGRAILGSVSSSGGDATTRRSTLIVPSRQQQLHAPVTVLHSESHGQDLNERVTDLQLAVNRLHQDVSAIRQVIERMSPLSASLILGKTAGLK
jgi:hypothetical protein